VAVRSLPPALRYGGERCCRAGALTEEAVPSCYFYRLGAFEVQGARWA
jgi:hypothetical protein